jgi:hypothetical protein
MEGYPQIDVGHKMLGNAHTLCFLIIFLVLAEGIEPMWARGRDDFAYNRSEDFWRTLGGLE